jgi:tetratricopeptide (TPR) repeat protein
MKFTKKTYSQLNAVILTTALFGCANAPVPERKPISAPATQSIAKSATEPVLDVQARKKYALSLQTESRLHEAQLQWRVLLAIDPNNTEYRNRLRVLQALINRRTKNIILLGHTAVERNNLKEAERHYLSALTIDPLNLEALESLRTLQTKTLTRLQEIKSAKLQKLHTADAGAHTDEGEDDVQERFYYDLGVQMFGQQDWFGAVREIGKYLTANPRDAEAREYYSLAQFQLALSQLNDNLLESSMKHLKEAILYTTNAPQEWYDMMAKIKYDLAELYYMNGIQTVHDNIDVAIEMWQKALINNPRHEKAQIRLDNAMQLKKNVSRIVDSESD